jgi:hypothetical protein
MRILLSSKARGCNFCGYLNGWRRYTQYVKAAWCAPLRKFYFYVYVPRLSRQFCLDVWLGKS